MAVSWEARPARPTSTRLRSRHARDAPAGGSIVAQTKRHTVSCGVLARCRTGRLEEPWHAQPNAPRPREAEYRDEWMTVIEMQEYMRASRNKAYDLIWSGEIDSYRLGRKLLVSRASVDAYIESRSGRK